MSFLSMTTDNNNSLSYMRFFWTRDCINWICNETLKLMIGKDLFITENIRYSTWKLRTTLEIKNLISRHTLLKLKLDSTHIASFLDIYWPSVFLAYFSHFPTSQFSHWISQTHLGRLNCFGAKFHKGCLRQRFFN